MTSSEKFFTIGETAKRCDVAASALRFYEQKGFIKSIRTEGNQRRYHASTLRVISVIKAAQNLGLTLSEIELGLNSLPNNRVPNKSDWSKLSSKWRAVLDSRIDHLTRLRDNLDNCIGCGCLSLSNCHLFNPDDVASEQGAGARYLLEDRPNAKND